jgi:hypothetical protein
MGLHLCWASDKRPPGQRSGVTARPIADQGPDGPYGGGPPSARAGAWYLQYLDAYRCAYTYPPLRPRPVCASAGSADKDCNFGNMNFRSSKDTSSTNCTVQTSGALRLPESQRAAEVDRITLYFLPASQSTAR